MSTAHLLLSISQLEFVIGRIFNSFKWVIYLIYTNLKIQLKYVLETATFN